MNYVEINKREQRLFTQSLLEEGNQPLSQHLSGTQRKAGEWKSFMVEKKALWWEGLNYAFIGGC